MSAHLTNTSYDPEFAERVVELIGSREDKLVLADLAGSPPSIRAEAIREFLWRNDAAGSTAARTLLKACDLPPAELCSVFTAAAESGDTKTLRMICQKSPEAIDSQSIRIALEGALRQKQSRSISFIADTVRLSPEVKFRAINPSLYGACDGKNSDPAIREELGTAEVIITKQYRDACFEQRRAKREQQRSAEGLSAVEKRHLRIERALSQRLRTATNRIRGQRQVLAESLFGNDLRGHSEITNLLIEQVTKEIDRQREIALASPAPAMQKRGSRVENLARWRSTNPTGHENSPSFAELLEKFHRTTRNSTDSGATLFSRFIDTVLTTWGTEGRPLSREKLCHLIKERHPRNETLTNTVLYNWKNHPAYSPRTESLTVLAEAFQLNQLHELLMFRLAKGTPCGNLKELLSAAERAIRTPDERRTRGELFTALCDASGIPLVVLAKTLAAQQVSYWKQGQRIEDRVMARRIVQLVNAPAIYPKDEREEVRELNSRIVAVLGGRLNSVLDAVFLAERSEVANSGGLLLALLIGQRGLAPLDYHAVAQLLNVTREKVHHMSSSSERRGGQITEAAAATILDYVQGVNAATRHLLSPVQRAERELALDTLTGIPSPVRLMWKLQNGEISHVGELCRLTRQRRGVLQESGMSGFELNKAGLSHARAAETADWLGFTEPQHRELRRLFITMATRTHTIQTPSQILDEIMSGQVPRHIGFQKLIDWTGLTRAEVARTMQLSKSSVAGYTMPHRGGRIVGERPLRALADELRLYHRSDDLVAVFSPKSYPEAHEQADIAGSEQLSTKRGISA